LPSLQNANIQLLLKGIYIWKEHKAITYKIPGYISLAERNSSWWNLSLTDADAALQDDTER
jgi:hypothetical protein